MSREQSFPEHRIATCLQDVQIGCPYCVFGVIRGMAQAVATHVVASVAMVTIGLQSRLDHMHQERAFSSAVGTTIVTVNDDIKTSWVQPCMENIGRL